MAKAALGRKRVSTEDYDSDGGFVEDAGPKHKKSKITSARSSNPIPEQLEDGEGNIYWELTRTRRVQISEFKGKTMIGLREFYEKDGKMLPGNKGISLPVDQFNSFMRLLPGIESALKQKNVAIMRPEYGSQKADKAAHASGDTKASSSKANHEPTSDEDDDEDDDDDDDDE